MATAPRTGKERAALRSRPAKAQVKQAAVLNADQIALLLAAAEPRDRALIAVLTAGACRINEALLLTWDDISADGVVTILGGTTKTGEGRDFALPASALAHLQAWRKLCPVSQNGWIFPGSPVANPLGVRAAQYRISGLAESLGLKGVSSHSFRRSALTAAHASGLSLAEVAAVSGHSSLASLQKYLDKGAAKVKANAARNLLFA
jgi:integrase/recombinase XerD